MLALRSGHAMHLLRIRPTAIHHNTPGELHWGMLRISLLAVRRLTRKLRRLRGLRRLMKLMLRMRLMLMRKLMLLKRLVLLGSLMFT